MFGACVHQCLRCLARGPGKTSLQVWTMPAATRQVARKSWARAYSSTVNQQDAAPYTDNSTSLPVLSQYTPFDSNYVSLIGTLGVTPQLKYFVSGSCNARLSIAIRSEPSEWVDVVVWNDLAQACSQLQKGARVCVKGVYKVEKWIDKTTQQSRKRSIVVANDVYMVDPSAICVDAYVNYDASQSEEVDQWPADVDQPPPAVGARQDDAGSVHPQAEDAATDSGTRMGWTHLAKDPSAFWDNRVSKWSRNPKAPDFVHKQTKDALWLNSAPAWILEDDRFTPVTENPTAAD